MVVQKHLLEPNARYSNVVGITNVAATLYCLGRQDEAENHWLRAVKLRPEYLEAVEHLVGLLYRKRSKEAIEIITFVQRALRLPGSTPIQPGLSLTAYTLNHDIVRTSHPPVTT